MSQNARSKEQEKKKLVKGNNFQLNQEKTSMYEKVFNLTVKEQAIAFKRDAINALINDFVKNNKIQEKNGTFTVEVNGKSYKASKQQLDDIIFQNYKDNIIDRIKQHQVLFETYKSINKDKKNIIKLNNNISKNENYLRESNKMINELKKKLKTVGDSISDNVYKNAMIQSKYIMAVHNANVNATKILAQLDKNTQNDMFRKIEFLKNKLDADKTETELFQKRETARNRDFQDKIYNIHKDFDKEADALLRKKQKDNRDAQEREYQNWMAEQKRQSEATAAQIKVSAQNVTTTMDEEAKKVAAANLAAAERIAALLKVVRGSADVINTNMELSDQALKDFEDAVIAAGGTIISHIPPECAGQELPEGCLGNRWIVPAQYTKGRPRLDPSITDVMIFQCSAGGHYCASQGQGTGNWNELHIAFISLY
jgi:hypothetical protein